MEQRDVLHPQAPPKSEHATERLREQARTVGEDVREMGSLAREAAREQVDVARRTAGRYVDEGKERIGEYEDQLLSYVRQRPLRSVLLASGVGFVLGLFLSRR